MHRILVEVSDFTGYSGAYTDQAMTNLREEIVTFLLDKFETYNNKRERNFAVSVAHVESDEFKLYADNVNL